MVAGSMASDRNPVPDALGVPDAPRILTSASGGFGMSFFELDCFRPNIGFTKPVRDDAFLIALQLRKCQDFDLYEDGRLIRPQQFEAGAVAIFDLRTTLASDLRDPFHAIDLYLPFEALNAISDDVGLARIDDLSSHARNGGHGHDRAGPAALDAAGARGPGRAHVTALCRSCRARHRHPCGTHVRRPASTRRGLIVAVSPPCTLAALESSSTHIFRAAFC